MVLKTQKQQFAKLWDYEAELVRSNKECSTEPLIYYKTPVWRENYKENIKPVNGDPIGVPGFMKMPGRPKKKRIKAPHESPSKPNRVTRDGRTITCGKCKQVGHNRLTCKNAAYMIQGPKRKRGRYL